MTAAVAEALLAGARALVADLPEDAVAVPAPTGYGCGATLFVTVDQAEHERRQRAGLGAVTRIEHLGLLLELPEGIPIPVRALAPWQQHTLRTRGRAAIPGHVVELTRHEGTITHVTRRAVRPVTAHLALLPGTASRVTIGRASAFAPFCARAVLTASTPRQPEALTEADYWGIGVAYRGEALVKPAPWRPRRHTAAGWLFTEAVYGQLLASN